MSTEIQKHTANDPLAAIERFKDMLAALRGIAEEFHKYNMIPESFYEKVDRKYSFTGESAEKAIGKFTHALVAGQEMGWGPLKVQQYMYVVGRKVSIYGDGIMEQITKHPRYHKLWFTYEGTITDKNIVCIAHIVLKGDDTEYTLSYGREEAVLAGLWPDAIENGLPARATAWGVTRDTWSKSPKDMLRRKVAARVLSTYFPDAAGGLPMVEDMDDEPEEIGTAVVVGDQPSLTLNPQTSGDVDRAKAESLLKEAEAVADSNQSAVARQEAIRSLYEQAKPCPPDIKNSFIALIERVREEDLPEAEDIEPPIEEAEEVEDEPTEEVPAPDAPEEAEETPANNAKLVATVAKSLSMKTVSPFFLDSEVKDYLKRAETEDETLVDELRNEYSARKTFIEKAKTLTGIQRGIHMKTAPKYAEAEWAKTLLT